MCPEVAWLRPLIRLRRAEKRGADPHYRNDWGFYDDTVLDEAGKSLKSFPAQVSDSHCLP